jgi:hypothetical protein
LEFKPQTAWEDFMGLFSSLPDLKVSAALLYLQRPKIIIITNKSSSSSFLRNSLVDQFFI